MRIRMVATVTGTVDGVSLPPRGAEVDVPDHVGAALCGNGQAAPVASKEPEETATADTADVEERAAEKQTPKPRKAASK